MHDVHVAGSSRSHRGKHFYLTILGRVLFGAVHCCHCGFSLCSTRGGRRRSSCNSDAVLQGSPLEASTCSHRQEDQDSSTSSMLSLLKVVLVLLSPVGWFISFQRKRVSWASRARVVCAPSVAYWIPSQNHQRAAHHVESFVDVPHNREGHGQGKQPLERQPATILKASFPMFQRTPSHPQEVELRN